MTKDVEPSRARPINPRSGQGEGLEHGWDDEKTEEIQEDEVPEDEEDEKEHITGGQHEKNHIGVARDLEAPTKSKVEEHNATHLPHRSWCQIRAQARGKEDAHRTVKTKGDKPVVTMDYKTFGEKENEDDKLTMIVLRDETYGSTSAHICKQK